MATNQLASVVKKVYRVLMRSQSAHLSDAQLLEKFIKNSDQGALDEIVHRHGQMVMGVCRRVLQNHEDAEDAFQATFLVLVRKASSLMDRDRVAGWLYMAAYKTAMRAKLIAAKRRKNESQVNSMPEPVVLDQQNWKDLQHVLDMELSLLPEKYREPIILCHIEGKSIKEAAQQLRCPEGTVSGRLSRGRSQLSRRLARHGVMVSSLSLAAFLTQNAQAVVSAQAAAAVVETATLLISGHAAGIAATRAGIIMTAVLRGMLLAKIRLAGMVLVLVALVAASSWMYASVRGSYGKAPQQEQPVNLPQLPPAPEGNGQAANVPSTAPTIRLNDSGSITAPPGIRLIAKAAVPADATDLSRSDYGVGSNCSRFGSISGIDYTGKDDTYILLADRGPEDGNTQYLCRFHKAKITLTGESLNLSLQSTTLLRDEQDRPHVGFVGALASTEKLAGRLDPEGVRVSSRGTLYISDEYGPFIDEFDQQGRRIKQFPVPARFQAQFPDADPGQELKRNKIGREPNRGMEGLALTPSGSKLVAIMQSPVIQEGGRRGTNVRILEIDLATDKMREFLFPLVDNSTGVSEILAINERQFLVLERGGKRICKIYKIDLSAATEIQHLEKLPVTGIPNGVTAVSKDLFLDLLDPRHNLAGELPTKVEGMTFGPDLPDGSRLLLVVTDNDFIPDQPTRLFAFAVHPDELR